MLGNLTLTALCLSRITSLSAIHASSLTHHTNLFTLDRSTIQFSLNSFYTNYHPISKTKANFVRSTMSHFLNSAIRIGELQLYRFDVTNVHKNYSPDNELFVNEMKFFDCKAEYDGGAIFIISNSQLVCNFTVFSNCGASQKGGAIFCIVPQVNFTQGCFSHCSAALGAAVYAPDSEYNFTFEGCFADYSTCTPQGLDAQSGYVFYSSARDIISNSNNFSSNHMDSRNGILYLKSTHSFSVTKFTFYNDSAKESLFSINLIQIIDNINDTNFIQCKSDNSFIFVDQFQAVLSNVHFVSSICQTYFTFTAGTTITLKGCVFDLSKDKIAAGIETNDSKFDSEDKPLDLEFVITNGCWFHSYYTWSAPKLASQIVVGLVIAVCLVGAFVIVTVHAYCQKKKRDEEEEKIVPNNYN